MSRFVPIPIPNLGLVALCETGLCTQFLTQMDLLSRCIFLAGLENKILWFYMTSLC